ncbi:MULTISPECIES: glycosyltransferase family 4 protein [Streptococcus]|uniref:Glycosyl transferase family 1 n=1 Tax=Streptococcus oralis subsp. tigurinus 2426 TaxID=1333865 RepID=S9SXZ7_STROR|nr:MULTISPECIES: glycosyltransferase family 4 protein [Streptococcus]EMG35277.1 exopolysaccharide biosynthesis protein,glycosyltransferase [Streptococcus oralis subsp. tigurinus 1366]EPX90040.1 glycosyl transferase family 1 [Streptococcus oralis subsp. tigurinus 2425]EPX91254.1 glycosyl transferase family 1 [Streptococcus oralis subsp. tigurinus 2426]OHQ22093.1 glycosyl transferase family 1 [Streptococcus sp. HMSC066F01]
MKRILYLHAGAEMYGADKVLLELIKGLDSKEFEAHVILPNDGVLVEALRQVGAQVSVLDYPILRRKYFNPKGIADYIRSYNFYAKQIALYAREHNIDMVHNNTAAVLEGIYLKRKLKLPLIWHVHEIIVKPKAISDFINMLMGRYADKIVTVSQAVANHIKQSPFIKDSQVEVIYNGVDNAVYYPMDASSIREKFDIAQDALVIGMIGRVNAIKGQNDFIEAVEPLLEKNEKAVAFLAGGVFPGEEWRLEELDNRIASSSVVSQIQRIDYYDKTSELYNMFDIFVLPSIKPDSLPTVVLEAMACSKPVVGYNNGGIAEMVVDDKSGCLVKPNRPQELSNAISLLLDSSEKREKFGRVGYQRQRELFSLESYIKNFSEFYDNLQ